MRSKAANWSRAAAASPAAPVQLAMPPRVIEARQRGFTYSQFAAMPEVVRVEVISTSP
jgi:hypothetical protein